MYIYSEHVSIEKVYNECGISQDEYLGIFIFYVHSLHDMLQLFFPHSLNITDIHTLQKKCRNYQENIDIINHII